MERIPQSMIEVKDLRRSFGSFHALKGISFSIGVGEIVGFLGPNGAGKSTTMKILTGFIPPSAGEARIVGHDVVSQSLEARRKLGVNSTGMPFNSVMAIELGHDRTINPMVNAGAIATTSLIPGDTADEKWAFLLRGLSRFAGRELALDAEVYASEMSSNRRNQGIAHLLDSYDRMYFDPDQATDVYTRQCSVRVSATDLAVMGATLADGGVNPVTGDRVVAASTCMRVLAVLATAGLYERSGDWLFDVGLPGKSGVSGGIVTIAPGKGAVGTFSPPLDEAGNSVRGQRLTRFLSDRLGLNLFASQPESERG